MTLCSGITSGAINQNCDANGNGLITGAAETIMIYNFNEISLADFTFDVTDTNRVTAITNPSGVQAYAFTGFRRTNKPSYELVPGTVSVGYNHILNFSVLESTYAQKENLMRLNTGYTIAVIENLDQSGDNTFEIYGSKVGLEVITNLRDIDDVENGAGFQINLQTGENVSKEPLMPLTFFETDYATTKALFDALITPGI
jgi:hypothetical protein